MNLRTLAAQSMLLAALLTPASCKLHDAAEDLATATVPNPKLVSMMNVAIEDQLAELKQPCAQCKASGAASLDAYLHGVAKASVWCRMGKDSRSKGNTMNLRLRDTKGTTRDIPFHGVLHCDPFTTILTVDFRDGRATSVLTDGAERKYGPDTMRAPLREIVKTLRFDDQAAHTDAYLITPAEQKQKNDEAWAK